MRVSTYSLLLRPALVAERQATVAAEGVDGTTVVREDGDEVSERRGGGGGGGGHMTTTTAGVRLTSCQTWTTLTQTSFHCS